MYQRVLTQLFSGSHKTSYYVKGTNSFFLDCSTLPYGIDDPQAGKSSNRTNRLDIPGLLVDLYNAAKSANSISGSKKPMLAPIIACNWDVASDQRSVEQGSCKVVVLLWMTVIHVAIIYAC